MRNIFYIGFMLFVSIQTAFAERLPNIILIMADDLGYGDMSYEGNRLAHTPNLEAMAENGVRLSRFYAASAVCSPTRGSVMTGRHPFRYGIFHANVGALPKREVTLAEILGSHGYQTGFFGKWHLGTLSKTKKDANRGGRAEFLDDYSPPSWHGFQTSFATESKVPTFDPLYAPPKARRTWWDAMNNPKKEGVSYGTAYWDGEGVEAQGGLSGDDSHIIMERAIGFIDAYKDKPFFAVIWFHTPHLPVVAGREDAGAIDSDNPYTKHYYGSIRAMDRAVGALREYLAEQGIAGNTLIWFTSDNGPEGVHEKPFPGTTSGLRAAKRSLYEGGIRVPAIVEYPAEIKAGGESAVASVTSDILPTILDLLGIDPPERVLDGVSILPTLRNVKRHIRRAPIGFEYADQIAFIGQKYKLIYPNSPLSKEKTRTLRRARLDGQVELPALGEFELYDLQNDPFETRNIAGKKPYTVKKIYRQMKKWRVSVKNSLEKSVFRH